ncbi:MAG: acetyltransferase family protein [Nocardia sp.]|uniref:GNAT family N-acetyltransferase n=1 Tax=Nocardia sp. TaxID=1821 RepID=UPI0026302718|nr:GNAT family N-acetyltransferase [Nocardia sp.]MCU1647297.1 acetyltransferase family protein [Nocardia sp.]
MTTLPVGLEFEHYDKAEARDLRAVVEEIYCRSYVEAIASRDTFDEPEAFMARFDAYTNPAQMSRLELVIARVDGEPVGQTWGWPLRPNAAWWGNLELDDPDADRAEFIAETGRRTFALSEIMVCAEYQNHGIAHALHDDLLDRRPEERATLLVEPDNSRAYAKYVKWGWRRVGTLRPRWPEAPRLDVLIRDLG